MFLWPLHLAAVSYVHHRPHGSHPSFVVCRLPIHFVEGQHMLPSAWVPQKLSLFVELCNCHDFKFQLRKRFVENCATPRKTISSCSDTHQQTPLNLWTSWRWHLFTSAPTRELAASCNVAVGATNLGSDSSSQRDSNSLSTANGFGWVCSSSVSCTGARDIASATLLSAPQIFFSFAGVLEKGAHSH